MSNDSISMPGVFEELRFSFFNFLFLFLAFLSDPFEICEPSELCEGIELMPDDEFFFFLLPKKRLDAVVSLSEVIVIVGARKLSSIRDYA